MALRYCLPWVTGRGGGLGNELIPWSRAFLAAQVLGARALPPAFGLNRRRYWRHFGTPRHDWLAYRVLKAALPVVRFGEADHLRHGGGDVLDSFRAYAQAQDLFGKSAYVVVTDGLWGGLRHIAGARSFVASTLYRSRYAPRNLVEIRRRLTPGVPTVGMHVRLGDFAAATDARHYRGKFNVGLPLDWYARVAACISARLGSDVQFLIASDGTPAQLAPLTEGLRCVVTADIPDSDCSDLLALAQCDLLVCSISSFSCWAAFLSEAPYLWYLPNLQVHPEGLLSIWGHEATQQRPDGPTRQALDAGWPSDARPRGWPVDDDGRVPDGALDDMLDRHRRRNPCTDLIQYGVVGLQALDDHGGCRREA